VIDIFVAILAQRERFNLTHTNGNFRS